MASRLLWFVATLAVAFSFPFTAAAQDTISPSPTSTSSPAMQTTRAPQTQTIHVGEDDWRFTPRRVDGRLGDTVEFRFIRGNHWVIRGHYDRPCVPYEYVSGEGDDRVAFSSGERLDDDDNDGDDNSVFRVRINDTDPIFFYSGAEGACVDHIMMGVVNPTEDITLIHWYEKAQNITFQLRPGDPWPDEQSVTASPSASATNDLAPTRLPEQDGRDQDQDQDDDDSINLSTGAIVGITVGGAGALVLGFLGTWYCCERRRSKRRERQQRRQCKCRIDEDKTAYRRKAPEARAPPTVYMHKTGRAPPKRPPRSPEASVVKNEMLASGALAAAVAAVAFAGREGYTESPVLPPDDRPLASKPLPILPLDGIDGSTGSYSLASYYEMGPGMLSEGDPQESTYGFPYHVQQRSPVELPIHEPENVPLSRFSRPDADTSAGLRVFSWYDQMDEAELQRYI